MSFHLLEKEQKYRRADCRSHFAEVTQLPLPQKRLHDTVRLEGGHPPGPATLESESLHVGKVGPHVVGMHADPSPLQSSGVRPTRDSVLPLPLTSSVALGLYLHLTDAVLGHHSEDSNRTSLLGS